MGLIMQASDDTFTDLTKVLNALNGNTNEVASKEDLVFALRNNSLKGSEVAFA